MWCDIEERRRQEHAVSNDDHDFRACAVQARRRFGGLQRFGLEDFQALSGGEALDRADRRLLTATRRTIRLGEHKHDVMPGPVERRERSLREFRRAGKN
jgi:hypothetical protein